MIQISGVLPSYRLCTACRSSNEVREITFSYYNGSFSQGIQVSLCKECIAELVDILKAKQTERDE